MKIEEDVKILEEMIENANIENMDMNDCFGGEHIEVIEHILSDYKRVLEINEVLLKENEELHKEIDRMKSLDIYKLVEDWETGQLIPIQKIKDKIKEIDKKIKYEENEKVVIYLHKQRNILQELLERRK